MLQKTIKYTDYDGIERSEPFYFHLNKVEIMKMDARYPGGLVKTIQALDAEKDPDKVIELFEDLILSSYGVKSSDGNRFMKVDENGNKLSVVFSQTEAFVELYMELISDAKAAAEFMNGILPQVNTNNKVVA